jgi:drug/metabolite transporter (DMT)-like permease
MNDQAKGLLITTLGALFVVPDSLFVRLIDADVLVVSFWRGMIAGGVIALGVLLFQGVSPFLALLRTGWHGVIYTVSVGASGVLFIWAVGLTSVANVVFIIASMPVFAAIYSRMFLGEPISRRMTLTMVGVMGGLAIIAFGSGESANASWRGDVMALGVSALFAAGLTAARRVRAVSMVPAVPIAYIGASLALLPFIDPFTVPDAQVWMVPAHGSFIVLSGVFLALGPRYITSAEVALLILLESVLAPLLAWAVVGENPGRWALVGGAVVIASLAISNLVVLHQQKRRTRARAL